ncbi:MAG: hypothetical protein JWP25_7188 [Bradyrhizobium sp.]|jgi:hypothetical protein|nr:hypothetical protein [Bradyrhizobium sp.]MEA2869571.1 hypothetical protein [Bradyrhizobium sp.]
MEITGQSRCFRDGMIDCADAADITSAMNWRPKYILLSFALMTFTIAGVSDAAAYLDPGTGSILFQSIIAVVASSLAVITTAWKSVTRSLGRLFSLELFNPKKDVRKD